MMGNLCNTMATIVEEEENEESYGLSPNEDTESPHEKIQDATDFIAPQVILYKTNRSGKMSQNDLIPKD